MKPQRTEPRLGRDEHVRVARTVAFTLTIPEDLGALHGLSVVAAACLTAGERARLTWAFLRSLTPEHAALVIDAIFPGRAVPLPTFIDPASEAAIWAASASRADLRACLVAAFLTLPEAEQRRFINRFGKVPA